MKRIAITGGHGFVGQILRSQLVRGAFDCSTFDKVEDPLVLWLSRRWTSPLKENTLSGYPARFCVYTWRLQKWLLKQIREKKERNTRGPDVLDSRDHWTKCFENIDAVIHLAAIPHPDVPGMGVREFERINYHGSVNIFEAAHAAGVKRFLFASSGQVYNINQYRRWKRFPISEDDADAVQSEGHVHPYGREKYRFEQYLKEKSKAYGMLSFALRLEFPGIWGASCRNLFTQTSIENLGEGFTCCLKADLPPDAHVLNICDPVTPINLVDLEAYIQGMWPDATRISTGNSSLLSTERANVLVGYNGSAGGHYYPVAAVF